MKLLPTFTAVCLSLTAYTSAALAADTSSDTATESTDSSVSGLMPTEPTAAPEAPSDKVTASASTNDKGREAKNAIYLDLAGPGLFYSLNYDREIMPDLSARIGISYFSIGGSASAGDTSVSAEFAYWAVPITASYLGIGSKSNMLELGGGPVIMHMKVSGSALFTPTDQKGGAAYSSTMLAMTAMAGYRHQPEDGGFVFRIGLSPEKIFGVPGIWPTGYLSLGAAF
jgi:hypothetical protein